MRSILNKVNKVEGDVSELKKMKGNMTEMKSDIQEIKKTQSEHGGLLLQIDEKTDHINEKVDHLGMKLGDRMTELEAG